MSREEPHEQQSELGNTHSETVFARDEQLLKLITLRFSCFFVFFDNF